MSPAARRLLAACLFFSGASSLVMEVAWSRALSLVLGNSHQAVATVVASMMTGLFLGSLLAAGKVGSIRDLPRTYGLLEMGIGAYGALTPLIFKLLALLLGPAYALPSGLFLFVRFLLVFVLLLPPSMGMGATLPVVTAALAAGRKDDSGSTGGWLYGLNTLGAFIGTLAGGFLLLPGVGLLKATLTGAGTSVSVGTMVWLLSDSLLKQERRRKAAPAAKEIRPAAEGGMPLILPLYAASGFLALVYEITWTRVLAPVAGSSVYSFTLILSAILAGIGLGSVLLSTRVGRWIHPGRGFVMGQILLGGVAFLSLWGLKIFPDLMLAVAARNPSDPAAFLLREFLAFGAIVLPPGLLLGALFPFASRLLHSVQHESGADVGRVYAWNTAGSLLGSLAAGFLLVETLGSQKTLALACLGSLSLGVAGLVLAPGKLFRPVAGVAAALLSLLIPLFTPSWDIYRMTTGVTQLLRNIRKMGPYVTVDEILSHTEAPDVRIMFHKEGKTCTVTVVKEWFDRWLRVDGKTDASTSPTDMLTQILLGQLPFFFAHEAKDVAVVGYGSGVTAHAVLSHPDVQRLDTIELEEQVIKASPLFEDVNGNPLADPRHQVIVDDARTALAYRPQGYDIIISEPSNPWLAGVNNLFTTDFYRLVQKRLRPGGIFVQWVQSYELSDDSLLMILNTVSASFPYAHLFATLTGPDMFMVASDRPLALVPEGKAAFSGQPSVVKDLAQVGISSLSDVALLYTSVIKPPPAGTLLNTDDNSLIQYRAPLELLRGIEPQREFVRTSEADTLALFYPDTPPKEALMAIGRSAYARQGLPVLEYVTAALNARGESEGAGEMKGLADALRAQVQRLQSVQQALLFAETRAAVQDVQGASTALAEAESAGLVTAEEWARAGLIHFSLLNFVEAERFLTQSVELNDPRFLYQGLAARGAARYRLGRPEEAMADVEAAKKINPDGSLAYLLYASALFDAGNREEAIRQIEQAIGIAPEDLRLVTTLENFRNAPPSASHVAGPTTPPAATPGESSAPAATPPESSPAPPHP